MKRFFSLLLTSIILLFPYKVFSLQWPTDNHTINCVFGEIHGGNHFHRGIDISNKWEVGSEKLKVKSSKFKVKKITRR